MTSVSLWDVSLSDIEIAEVYNSGKITYFEILPNSIKDDVACLEMSSRDNP